MIRMSPDLFCSDLGTFLLELIQTIIKFLFFIEYDLEDKVNIGLFCGLLNENPASDNTPETKASAKNFTIGVDSYQMCKVVWSDPDYVTRHSTVEVKITVTPVYAYELNPALKQNKGYE